ncbi:D-alanyl-D-alanine carboxypeptidase/D-alanyl-D-alanine endopeptidase [Arcanobacterium phocae]|uniref:D-alanyl-D-alanine carboxypeptidase/D-alanyl-D-alanine endopeptidase n=1 Tax=Arcanobacterium phocae TaxID=131112 RepID=UPI001C11EC85
MKKVKIGISVFLTAVGGYIVADAWDLVPGLFTTKPPLTAPLPYPQLNELHLTKESLPEFATFTGEESAHVRTILEEFRTDARMSGVASVVVVDPQTKETLGSLESQTPLRPASTMKYLTAVAALTTLGPNTTLDTHVTRSGDDIYLVGDGDVTLVAGDGDSKSVIGRAGLNDLAHQASAKLSRDGVKSVTVHVDSSRYEEPLFHPQAVAEENTEFVMPIRPIAVNRGKLSDDKFSAFVTDPDLAAANEFAARLTESGIFATVADRAQSPQDATEIARTHSAPVRELIDVMMTESDNTLAEVFGHEVAIASEQPATFAGASKAVTQALVSGGYSTGGMVIDDNSGLSENNRVPAPLLAQVLQQAWECDKCKISALGSALPVGGLEGTLAQRFLDSPARGMVRAKTGTLSTTTALAGYVTTKAGRPLILVALVSDHQENAQLEIRGAIDDMVGKLVDTL